HVNSCFVTPVFPAGDSLLLLGPFEDFGNPPPLGGRKRPGLHQQYAVTDATLVLLVVFLVLLGTAHDLAVLGVLHAVFHGHDNGLVHLVADHEALAGLPVTALVGSLFGNRLCRIGAHFALPSTSAVSSSTSMMMPSSRSRSTV